MNRVGILIVIFLCWSFGASQANAQSYNLTNLPSDFAFKAMLGFRNSQPIEYRVTFLSKSGLTYSFETIANLSGVSRPRTRGVIANEATLHPTIRSINSGRYTPHDCPPLLKPFANMGLNGTGPFPIHRTVQHIQNIWVTDRFIMVNETLEFIDRICITYDDFGFWQDFVVLDKDLTPHSWAARTNPLLTVRPEMRVSNIRIICEQQLNS